MSNLVFDNLYKKLNKEQKEAVDTVEGPVMVVAGPGTGKTTILTLRIANILLKTDADPDSILALTFTESAVNSMREKLVEIIGGDAYKVGIFTFHGFANYVISRNPDSFPRIVGSRHINQVGQIRIIEDIILNGSFKLLKPYGNPYFYIRPALKAIQDMKRDNISPEKFAKLIEDDRKELKKMDRVHKKGRYKGQVKSEVSKKEKDIEKNEELLTVYKSYEDRLREDKRYDFDDMILEFIEAIEEGEDLLRSLQEKYQYILADEHQDANLSQNRILELLASYHDFPNLFIVGDGKQAIFRFQGASLENFNYFRRVFPESRLISLVSNYRSAQTILDAAYSLISKADIGDEIIKEKLKSQTKGKSENIYICEFSRPHIERQFVAREVKKILGKKGGGQVAILYRDNKDAFTIADILEREKIPFVIESDVDIFRDEDIIKIMELFRLVLNPRDNELLSQVLYYDFLEIEPLLVHSLLEDSRKRRKKLVDIVSSASYSKKYKDHSPEKLRDFWKKLTTWSKVAGNKNAADTFEIIVRESGFLSTLLKKKDSVEKLSKLDRLFRELLGVLEEENKFYLNDFIEHLDMLSRYDLSIKTTEEVLSNERQVRLMTAHRSKGLEFETVFITGVQDGHWGNRKSINHFKNPNIYGFKGNDIDDERRLFYVSLTRAKKEVFITYSRKREDGKGVLRSQFIEEMEDKFYNEIDTKKIEEKIDTLYIPKKKKERPVVSIEEKDFLNRVFREQGLSVTALNNYLSCPWKFFFENLIRIPKAPNKFQRYGISIHAALFFYFEKYRKGQNPKVEDTIKVFEDSLRKNTSDNKEFKELFKKGQKALRGYLKERSDFQREILNEYEIVGVYMNVPNNERVLLKGKLDKILLREGNKVAVLDYKTGKPKSRNFIEGKTKTSNGDYKRQLVFYKLLLDQYKKDNLRMEEGIIEFVEPDKKGKYRRESFEVEEEEVFDLKRTIENATKDIINLSFWKDTCDDDKCSYCRLRASMKGD